MAEYLQGRVTHIDQHLSNVALNYRPVGMIWDMIAPIIPVPHQTDNYVVYTQADFFRQQNTLRSPNAKAQLMSWEVGSAQFYCENYALGYDIPDETRFNADPIFGLSTDEGAIMRISDALQLDAEIRIADQVTNTSNVGSNAAVASAWTDYTNSDPRGDVSTGIRNVHRATGYRPNRMVISGFAWDHLSLHDDFRNIAGGAIVAGGGMTARMERVKEYFQLDQLIIAGAFKDTSDEGAAAALTEVWADHVLVYYAPSAPSITVPSFMYTFRWTVPGIPNFNVIRHPYDSKHHNQGLESGYYQDEIIASAPLGFLINNVTSST